MAAEFTHLHLHTDYSLLDGACDVDKLAAHLSNLGQTAAAMTDDHRAPGNGDTYNHFLVLAENEAGYRNLVRLTSEAALHGFYSKPRVSKEFLAKHSEGLIGFSGCLGCEVNQNLM